MAKKKRLIAAGFRRLPLEGRPMRQGLVLWLHQHVSCFEYPCPWSFQGVTLPYFTWFIYVIWDTGYISVVCWWSIPMRWRSLNWVGEHRLTSPSSIITSSLVRHFGDFQAMFKAIPAPILGWNHAVSPQHRSSANAEIRFRVRPVPGRCVFWRNDSRCGRCWGTGDVWKDRKDLRISIGIFCKWHPVSWWLRSTLVGWWLSGWWFGTWILWLSIYWECHHPNWRTHILNIAMENGP